MSENDVFNMFQTILKTSPKMRQNIQNWSLKKICRVCQRESLQIGLRRQPLSHPTTATVVICKQEEATTMKICSHKCPIQKIQTACHIICKIRKTLTRNTSRCLMHNQITVVSIKSLYMYVKTVGVFSVFLTILLRGVAFLQLKKLTKTNKIKIV